MMKNWSLSFLLILLFISCGGSDETQTAEEKQQLAEQRDTYLLQTRKIKYVIDNSSVQESSEYTASAVSYYNNQTKDSTVYIRATHFDLFESSSFIPDASFDYTTGRLADSLLWVPRNFNTVSGQIVRSDSIWPYSSYTEISLSNVIDSVKLHAGERLNCTLTVKYLKLKMAYEALFTGQSTKIEKTVNGRWEGYQITALVPSYTIVE